MPEPVPTLRDIRKACELGPLRGPALNEFWVDTDAARDPHRFVRHSLRELLGDRDDCKILFYGHSGSGKSTELNKLVNELGPDWFVVGFSVRDEMSLTEINVLAYSNQLVNAVRTGLAGRHLLLIVEDLDKLDIATARQVFFLRPTMLTGLDASIVYTIPIFTFHSPEAGLLRTQFHRVVSLPMIKVAGPRGERAEGYRVVREIIGRRLGASALTAEALDLLIEKTGGVLQHAFEVIVGATLLRDAPVPLAGSRSAIACNGARVNSSPKSPSLTMRSMDSKTASSCSTGCANVREVSARARPAGRPARVSIRSC